MLRFPSVKQFIGLVLCCLLCACRQNDPVAKQTTSVILPEPAQDTATLQKLAYKIIPSGGGFGYEVSRDGRTFIYQPTIPAVGGNQPFRTREQAARVALLVMGKIRRGIMPPAVTVQELDSLGIGQTPF